MKRYFVLILAAALLLPMLVVPGAVNASRKGQRPSPGAKPSIPAAVKRQAARQQGGAPISVKAVGFAESLPLRDLPQTFAADYSKGNSLKYGKEDRQVGKLNSKAIRKIDPNVKPDTDAALQLFTDSSAKADADAPSVLPAPSVVFDGNSNADNATLFGFRLSPPDTNGDVGPNHYVQTVNLTIRIFDKLGTPLIPAAKFSSIFAPLGAPCGSRDDGDPIALYDPMADRWLLSQFCFPFGDTTPPFFQTVAVSKTPDPTGAYYLYNFAVSTGNNEFPDYPHFGIWPDGYYMTTNQFLNGGSFDGGGVFAFDRQKMLVGDPSASFIYFNRNLASFPEAQAGMLPADMDGVRPPPPGTPCPFAYFTANEFTDPADGMRIFDFHADFATPANSTFIERPESAAVAGGGIPVAAFNPLVPGTTRDNIPQPPPASATTARLDAIADRVMHRLQYINFGTHESLVVNHTVSVGTDTTLANYRAGVRYYEFRKAPGVAPYTVNEQGTFAGAQGDTTHRWMGSAAMNAGGDLAVGYSASSLTVFPSLRYAARFAGDPAGSLAQGEQVIFAGTGVQTDTGSRWGDYSNLSLDPSDDCSYWFTSETYTAASQATSGVGWVTKIGKFNLGSQCTAFPKGTISGTVTNCNTGLPVADAVVKTSNGFFTTTNALGQYTLPKMSPDTVTVTATRPGFSTANANSVAVTNGNTTTTNLCIAPISIIVGGGSSIVSAGTNGVPDPGETVTVALGVQNTGGAGACTTALTGTLQPTGGVTNPSAPQNYGATCSGDPVVTKNFTFTVSPTHVCGAPITLSLALVDGATNYGTLTYTFGTGVIGTPTTVSYTGAAVAIPDNVAAGVNIPLVVSGVSGNIGDLNFRIDGSSCNTTAGSTTVGVDHTWVGDLVFKLTSPQGTTVTIIDRPGAGANGSSGNNFCQTLLDDDFLPLRSIEEITATGTPPLGPPYTGTFNPQNPMSAFDGQNPNGTWTLNVSDNAGIDTGSVRAFSLVISNLVCDTALPPIPDLTGDGKADIAVWHPLAGSSPWLIRDSTTGIVSGTNWGIGTGPNPDKPVPADYDGDGKLDVAVWRPTDGNWYILNNPSGAIGWGNPGDKPVPADYDGDGKADIAVFRPSEGNWYIRKSTGGVQVTGWGNATDRLVPADYDGDGKADVAVWRASEGNWYIRKSTGGVQITNWGISTDVPVPSDYDGDRKADISVYRQTGDWYIVKSTGGVTVKNWGNATDIPVPADYDGDKKADIAVYRPAGGDWYILNSGGSPSNSLFNLGLAGDIPLCTGIIPQ
jgi:subtilisin-like proprotein convertase family protein